MSPTDNSTPERPDRGRMIHSERWALQVCAALGIDGARVRRIVIDAEARQALKVYVEYFGDNRLLDVRPPSPAEVQIVTGAPRD